jgi:hypothetical protein
MTYRGHIENGSVVLDDTVVLPDGAEVRVEPLDEQGKTLADRFGDLIGCISDFPSDMAENHNHYIHGTPLLPETIISSKPAFGHS